MTRKINLTPISWPVGAAGAAVVFVLVWLFSKPHAQLYDARLFSVFGAWTLCLSVLCVLYIKRYFFALWLHGALAACFWTRIFADVDRHRAQILGPYGLGEQLDWIVGEDLFPLFCIALLASLMLVVASVCGMKMYRRARGETQ